MILWLLLMAAPEPVALRLEEVGELPMARGIAIANALSSAIEARTGRPTVLDEPSWPCDAGDRCVAEIAARAHASSVVLLRVFGGATMIHVRAERAASAAKADFDLPDDGSDWGAILGHAAEQLFPEPPPVVPAPSPVSVESSPALLPIVLLASAGILTGIGVGFGISSQSAGNTIESEPLYGSRYRTLADRQEAHGIVADVCFVGAGGALVAAVVSWLMAEP